MNHIFLYKKLINDHHLNYKKSTHPKNMTNITSIDVEVYLSQDNYATIKILMRNLGDMINISTSDHNLYFDLTYDENDPDYVFTYKLMKLFPAIRKLKENYGKANLKFDLCMYPVRKKTGLGLCYGFNEIRMSYEEYEQQYPFINDIIQIISYICNKHNRKLGVLCERRNFMGYVNMATADYRYSELNVISEQDAKQLFEEFDYTKVIPFDMRYCLRKNIKLPLKIKILVKLFGYDIAGEIAKYLYVICGK